MSGQHARLNWGCCGTFCGFLSAGPLVIPNRLASCSWR